MGYLITQCRGRIALQSAADQPLERLAGLGGSSVGKFRPAKPKNVMSSISSTGSSSSNNAAAYQEYLARAQAQKQANNATETKAPTAPAPTPAADVDHDGDSR